MSKIVLEKIISGGQTGVDRAALDAALEWHIPIGGWCPNGRLAEDGIIAAKYLLKETASIDYAVRTKCNVKQADATLIISQEPLSGGTKLTAEYAKTINKPCCVWHFGTIDDDNNNRAKIIEWLMAKQIRVLNIAGPRASEGERVYARAYNMMTDLLASCISAKEVVK